MRNSVVVNHDLLREVISRGGWTVEGLVPDALGYFERFCGPDPGAADPDVYLDATLPEVRRAQLDLDLKLGLPACLLGALNDRLYPGAWLERVGDDDLWDALATWRPEAEPLSLLATLDIALLRQHDPRFSGLAERAVSALLRETFALPGGDDFYELFPPLVEVAFERVTLLDGGALRPPYWRRMCAWMQAGLICRFMPTGAADVEELARHAEKRFGLAGKWFRLADLRREPRAFPGPLWGEYVRAQLLARLWRLAEAHLIAGRQVARAGEIETAVRASRESLGQLVLTPGPLDGHRPFDCELPEVLVAQLDTVSLGEALNLVRLWALIWRLPDGLREGLAAFVDDGAEAEVRIRVTQIEGVAWIAAAQGDQELAGVVAAAALGLAPQLHAEEDVARIFQALAIAAAAWRDEAGWASWLRQHLVDLADRVPSGKPAGFCWFLLQMLGQVTKVHLGIVTRALAGASAGMS